MKRKIPLAYENNPFLSHPKNSLKREKTTHKMAQKSDGKKLDDDVKASDLDDDNWSLRISLIKLFSKKYSKYRATCIN